MRACELRGKNSEAAITPYVDPRKYKLVKEVLSGTFPKRQVSRMSYDRLEQFVLNLVKHTCVDVGAKNLSMIKEKPKWWPRDVLIERPDSKQQVKQFRLTLKQLIVNCCNFFKNTGHTKLWINDENFDVIKVNGVRPRKSGCDTSNSTSIKLKTLSTKNICVVSVPKIVPELFSFSQDPCFLDGSEEITVDPVDQAGFLKCFDLVLNNNALPKPEAPSFSRPIKFLNYPQIPLSSDIGKSMMERENYNVPEFVAMRRLERQEWYVNKEIPRISQCNYEVSFVPNNKFNHIYKFPKKQFHQFHGNYHYRTFLFKLCRPLIVLVENEDLIEKKRKLDSFKVSVKVPKLKTVQLKKYLCREARVVLRKTMISSKSNFKCKELRPRNIK